MRAHNTDILSPLLDIARDAGALIMDVYQQDFTVDYKGPNDPVTTADRQANDLICERLTRLFPGVPIVAEESEPATFAGFREATDIFFVDPLDGTKEFIQRNGEFVVMLGLVEGDHAAAGVIYSPTQDKAWLGLRNKGAWQQSKNGSRESLTPRSTTQLSDAELVASRWHRSATTEAALKFLGVGKIQALGSAGLKGACVAEGKADAYLSPGMTGKRWDACAIDALLNAAGCKFTDSYGQQIDYRDADLSNRRGLLGAPIALHSALLQRMTELRAQKTSLP